jgi:amino acid adenylation domain-containing protein/non-ribosomal peptide synthase protein (TIGR01720 family)/FkbM family methyltransferase
MSELLNKPKHLAMSKFQRRFFVEWAMDPKGSSYNVCQVIQLRGQLNREALSTSVNHLILNNEIVHSKFSKTGDKCFHGNHSFDQFYSEEILSNEISFELQLRLLVNKPFDLTKDPLLRIYLLEVPKHGKVSSFFLTFVAHHIICDSSAQFYFLNQIQDCYNKFVEEKLQGSTVKSGANEIIDDDPEVFDKAKSKKYWIDLIGDCPLKTSLPYKARIDPSNLDRVISNKASEFVPFELDEFQSASLRTYSTQNGISLFVVFSSIFGYVLSKYCNQRRLLLNYAVNMRPTGVRHSGGCFVNNLPLKIEINTGDTLIELINSIDWQRKAAKPHQGYDFQEIISDQRKDLGRDINDFLNVGIVQAYLAVPINLIGVEVTDGNNLLTQNIFELGLRYDERSADNVRFEIDYRLALFSKSTIESLIYSFKKVVTDFIAIGNISLSDYWIGKSDEYDHFKEWNRTEKPYRQEATLHELFYEQVARSSESVALVYGDSRLSYGELNQRSNQLARYIRQQYLRKTGEELKADTLIALCLDRSPEMVIGILAVLKAGGAYVPIDPEYPQERIDYMLEDTGAQLVLTHQEIVDRGSVVLPSEKVLLIDLTSALYQSESSSDLDVNGSSSDLAYVIYTSGTTGRPKGVMVEHRSIHNTIADLYSLYREGLKVSAYTSYVFDVSVSEIFSTLLQGSELHLLPQSIRTDSVAISEYLQSNKIVLAYLPPVMLSQLPVVEHPHLKTLIYAGEPCDKYTAGQWSSRVKLYNYYGPTEASVYATFKEIGSDEVEQIGKPLSNTEVYVLDSFGQVVPVGVAGELYIGGSGIARGYLNNRELTSERFLPNRFKGDGSRLYRTGDLVRWLADGNLEYLGRNDEQVKIRGYRIELGEIEHALLKLEGIRQASVLCKERKSGSSVSKYLVGYYVSDVEWSPDRITDELSSVLPEYMVPAVYVRLEHFPLTVNGKLDKRKLPEPEFGSEESCIGPSTELEDKMCLIWQDVLGISHVGVQDDFFRIGGDSILSIQVSSRLRQLGYACHVRDIFTHRTIEKLSRHLETSSGESTYKTEQGLLTGSLDLLPVQRWFMEQVDNGRFRTPHHWNQSILIRVGKLDQDRLKAILPKLAWQHDMLRARYRKTISGWEQYYSESIEALTLHQLNVEGLSESAIESVLTGWQSGFDLERGPLFQAGLLEGYRDGSSRIYMAFHHLVVDAVSWRILLEDLRMLYEGKDLGLKASSYRQWVERVKSYGETHASEWSYWLSQVDQLPAASSYGEVEQQEFSDGFELGKKLTDELLHNCSQAYHTEVNDLLLTALAYALKDVSELGVHGVTLEGHGRELIDSQIDHSHTVGWFTTMYPVRLELQRDYAGSIRHIKESLREIPQKGIGFGALRMVHPGEEKVVLPAISFNYLGQFEASQSGEWELSGEGSGLNQGAGNVGENVITINGIVTQGVLRFGITTRLGAAQTIKLSNALRTHLEEIIAHCGKQRPGFTPSDFKGVRISQDLLDKVSEIAHQSGNEIEGIYAANSLQQGFIYHAISEPQDDAYRVQQLYDYEESLDVAAYLKAWESCINQYPILRTGFNWEEDIIQIIYKRGRLEHEFHDLSGLDESSRNASIQQIQQQDRSRGFDLSSPTQMRLHILKHRADYYTVLKSDHHSISDGWSVPILLAHVHQYYSQHRGGERVELKPDTAYQQSQRYIQEHRDEIVAYWEEALSQVEGTNDISSLLSEPIDVNNYREVSSPQSEVLQVSGDRYRLLKELSHREGVTINVIVQFLWHKLLQVYSNSSRTVVGTTVSGRDLPIPGIEDSVGLYINTLPLVIDWSEERTILSQLHHIQDRVSAMSTHSFASLSRLQKDGDRLFHSLFVFENYPLDWMRESTIKVTLRDSIEKANYPLCVEVHERNNNLLIKLRYDTSCMDSQKAKSHMNRIDGILGEVLLNPNQLHSQICLLSSAEFTQVVEQWNRTEKSYRKETTLQQLFYEQVARSPESVALVYGNSRMSYGALNDRSNRLARRIRREYASRNGHELQPGTLISLCLDRSLDTIIGILAVLKAGGAYVPLDPCYPQDRIDYLLSDTGCLLVLSHQQVIDSGSVVLPHEKLLLIDIDDESESSENLETYSNSKDLAYVIYTSGTTGRPKGVMVEHHSVVRLFNVTEAKFKFDSSDVWSLFHSYVFDFSVWEIWGALCYGGRLVVISDDQVKDTFSFFELCRNEGVTVLNQTPSSFYRFLDQALYNEGPADLSLRYIIFGGEVLNTEQIRSWWSYALNNNLDTRLINMYGITETTVHVTFKELCDEFPNFNIGKPLEDLKAYILDTHGQPLPVGVVGELYIGGDGVARGYLNNAILTDKRFILNPFEVPQGDRMASRLYRTGDLAKWCADGSLEYFGRNDDQIKIRGYRIELGEVEHAMLKLDGIRQASVLCRERQTDFGVNKYLVGYYCPDANSRSAKATFIEKSYFEEHEKDGLSFFSVDNELSAFAFSRSELNFLYDEIFKSKTYLSDISISDGDVIFDVGANIGIGSIFFSKQAADLDIYSFEPIPDLHRVLNMNLFVYSDQATFKTFDFGIGATNQDGVLFTYFKDNSVISTQYPDLHEDSDVLLAFLNNNNKEDENRQIVESVMSSKEEVVSRIRTISTVIREHGIEQIDVLKIDVEKAEMDVLAGIEERDWGKIMQVVMEVHDKENRLAMVESLLVKKGFEVSIQQEAGLKSTGLYTLYGKRPSHRKLPRVSSVKVTNDDPIAALVEEFQCSRDYRPVVSSKILKQRLEALLPSHMIPSVLIELDTFPLTINGKLDRAALPQVEFDSQLEQVKPSTEQEILLCEIWRTLLGLDSIGIKDDFFSVGGNSILAIQLSHKMSRALSCEVRVADIFKSKNIVTILKNLNERNVQAENTIWKF